MGLAGRKSKQRIGADPRNLTWADDAAKFGTSYLTKMGWDPSKGLGVEGEGRTSHIKVAQKLNLLGIGAGAQQGGKDGVAWKQNRDYELLLKRLNEVQKDESVEESQEVVTTVDPSEEVAVDGKKRKRPKDGEDQADGKKKRKKDKKPKESDTSDDKKKKKKSKAGKKERKANEMDAVDTEPQSSDEPVIPVATTSTEPPGSSETPLTGSPLPSQSQAFVPRAKAHRARFLKSKQLASRSSSAVAEILGISASVSAVESAAPTPGSSGTATPVPQADQELTTATQSVADYFKAKLAARALGRSGSSTPSGSGLKNIVADASEDAAAAKRTQDDRDEAPCAGLGSRSVMDMGLRSADSVTLTAVTRETAVPQPMKKFGGLMGCAIAPAPRIPAASDVPVAEPKDLAKTESGGKTSGEVGAQVKEKRPREKGEKKKKKEKKKNREVEDREIEKPETKKKNKKTQEL